MKGRLVNNEDLKGGPSVHGSRARGERPDQAGEVVRV